MSIGEGSDQVREELAPSRSTWRKWLVAVGVAFLVGLVAGIVLNSALSGPSIEVVEATFEAATADLDGIAVEGEDGEYDLTHAAGVECLPDMNPGGIVYLGIANIDRSDAEIPFVAELGQDRVVLWVECVADPQADL